ncbi:hypothetical protein TWF788_007418 [Orbilia oligospora]|uniref:CBM1 domain-containing protein n=1 Tax=Orbilia oligospora TaxID=2813651 RepID=A0A7C8PTD8_ORBOL|nr:hypothetical protein TWF788_007418 [Orbilia oligospora]
MMSRAALFFILQAAATVVAQVVPGVWQQCDGIGWRPELKGLCQDGLFCTTYNSYYAQCIPGPTPTTRSSTPETTPPTTSYRTSINHTCSQLSTCTTYPWCCGATKTDCRTYCLGQTAPTIQRTTVTCSCPPKTSTSLLVVPPMPTAVRKIKRQEYVTTCPMETYYTTYALCCGASGTATGSVCRGSRHTTIDHPIPRCVICTNTTTCPMETYYTTYPLCCGASGTATGSVCSGSRHTPIPHPVVRCASCTTRYPPVATAIVTKIDVFRVD